MQKKKWSFVSKFLNPITKESGDKALLRLLVLGRSFILILLSTINPLCKKKKPLPYKGPWLSKKSKRKYNDWTTDQEIQK